MKNTRASPAPQSKCKSEIRDPLSIAAGSYHHLGNVSKVVSTTDLKQNLNDEHGVQEVCKRIRVVDTIISEDIEGNICGSDEKVRLQVNTKTRGEEVKNESPTQYQHASSGGSEIQTTDVGPVEFTSLKAMFHRFLKACITEENVEEVTALAGLFDKLFQNYLNTLNAATKTTELEDSHKAASVNGEQQEHLDVSVIDVSFPETIEERHNYCLQESVMQKKAQNVKPEQRLSTALQAADPADKGRGVNLIMGHGCDIQQKSTICGSNGLKPFALSDEGIKEGTSEETAGNLNITTTQSRGGGNNKDVKLSGNSIPLSAANDQESLKFLLERGSCLSDIANDTITAKNLGQPIEIDDSQHKRISENIDTSIIDSDRGEVEPSTGSPEKTKDASSMIGHEAAAASDDECNSIASSNTEIYEEADCEDIEMHEQETQEVCIKTGVNNFAASADVSFQFQSQTKLNRNAKTEGRTARELVLFSGNSPTLVELLKDNSRHMQLNTHSFSLEGNHSQAEPNLPTSPCRRATTIPVSELSCLKSGLVNGFERSSDNLHNKIVSESKVPIVRLSLISNLTKTKSNKSESNGNSSKSVNRKRISFAAGIVYEDEVSSPEVSQCSTTTQTFLPSIHSEVAREVPSSRVIISPGISSSVWNHVDALVLSKLPPGSTLRGNRGVFHTKDKEKPFACGHCGKAFTRKKYVYRHMKMRHYEKHYSCEFCGKRYALPSHLAQHVSVHTQEKLFTCDQCGKRFRLKGSLRNHKYTHAEERLFHCKKCNKSFKTRVVLSKHRESHNNVEQTCNICNRKFSVLTNLKLHMMIHTGEKPFKCSLCDKKFRLKVQLQKHVDTHSGKKRLSKPCCVCGKTVWVQYLATHMRMHTGEKPFECKICGKKFPKKQNLEGHLRSHTGEKPFACSGCDKRFALYSNMMTHKAKCTTLSEN